MKLINLKPGDIFETASGTKFQVLLMNKSEQKKMKDRIKARRLDTGEIFYLTDMIVTKCK